MIFSVVIPNWNGMKYLPTCLMSLRKQTQTDVEVIVVDNGSHDESVAFIQREFPEVRTVCLGRNTGFPYAVNRGIEAAKGKYIAVLNNDTDCDPRWLEEIRKAFEAHPDVGFCATKIIEMRDRLRIGGAGDVCYLNGIAMSRWKGDLDEDHRPVPEYVFSASACASIYRRELVETIGLFDEDFYFSFEDVDYGFRAQLAGFRCLYVPTAIVQHLGCGSIFNLKVHRMAIYHLNRNQLWYIIKNFPTPLLRRYGKNIVETQVRSILSHLIRPELGFVGLALRAKLSTLFHLPALLRKRRVIQANRKASIEYLEQLLLPPIEYAPFMKRVAQVALKGVNESMGQ
jgi:hypothetical protein